MVEPERYAIALSSQRSKRAVLCWTLAARLGDVAIIAYDRQIVGLHIFDDRFDDIVAPDDDRRRCDRNVVLQIGAFCRDYGVIDHVDEFLVLGSD